MNIAKDGSAIIGGHVVRKEGVNILRALASFEVATYVPALSKSLGDVYSDQHLYSTLNRLCKLIAPALCLKKVVFVEVFTTKIRRVTYEATTEVKAFFAEISDEQP
jgi:hypothetical protein